MYIVYIIPIWIIDNAKLLNVLLLLQWETSIFQNSVGNKKKLYFREFR